MRYSITGATINQVKSVGATNIKEARSTRIIFAELTEEQAARLKSQGCTVSGISEVRVEVMPPIPIAGVATYTPLELTQIAGLESMRRLTDPPLYGENMNLAIIDTGIRESHELVMGRVVYRKNYTSDIMGDEFNHGTGVASIITTIAPLCNILNLKVLNNRGEGTEEEVVLAIDDCISLHDTWPEIAPSVINLSLGAPDDGNRNNILRVACRAAIGRGILVAASAGNSGPKSGTITSPACERYVGAVGSAKYLPDQQTFIVSSFSSRGPTLEGLTKPDALLFGEDIELASSISDTATIAKSGTSFATPFGSGLILMCQEGIIRRVAYPEGVPEGLDPTVTRPFTSQDLMDSWAPRISVKPQSMPLGKDNDYGYGLPFGPLIAQMIGLKPAIDVSAIFAPVLAIAMLSMVTATMKDAFE